VQSFPQDEALAEMMRQAGLSQIVQYPMTFGTVALNVGRVQK
jgi:ubiquinone/menaquinone biosynthesis C-methylase UbiE